MATEADLTRRLIEFEPGIDFLFDHLKLGAEHGRIVTRVGAGERA